MKKYTEKWWFKWLVLGLVIRFVVMPFAVHPDLWGQTITSYFFSYKGVLNVYDYIATLPASSDLASNFSLQYIFIYPPLTYYTQGLLNLLVRPFLSNQFVPTLISDPANIYAYPTFFIQVFLLKLPYIVVDVISAFLLAAIFDKKENKQRAFMLWMLNPLTIYATFMMGQNDVLPVLFTIASLYFWKREKYSMSLLSLGIGGSYKLYPLFFVVPAAFLVSRKFVERIKYLVLGVLPYIVTTLPFLTSKGYRTIVLANPESTKILFMGLPVSGAESVYVFLFVVVFIYFYSFYANKKPLFYYFLAIMLTLFSVTHFHPQWFLWVSPFLIISLIKTKFASWPLVATLFVSWLFITFMFEASLSYGMFAPLFPGLKGAVSLKDVVARYLDPFLVLGIFRSLLAGASAFMIYSLFKSDKTFGLGS